MAKDIHSALDEVFNGLPFQEFQETGDKAKLTHHVKILIKCIGEAYCKQSAAVYGVNKYSTQQLIKAALMDQGFPKIEFEVRGFGKRETA